GLGAAARLRRGARRVLAGAPRRGVDRARRGPAARPRPGTAAAASAAPAGSPAPAAAARGPGRAPPPAALRRGPGRATAAGGRPRAREERGRGRLLAAAVALAPHDAAAWLWLFEACVVDGDLAAAASAVRRCRHHAAPRPAAAVLARARLLEMRGRLGAAAAL